MSQQNKKEEKSLTGLTDFDIFELYINCVQVFVEKCTALDLSADRPFELGQILWEKTIKARDDYRKGHPEITGPKR